MSEKLAAQPHEGDLTRAVSPATIDLVGATATTPLLVGATRLLDGTLDLSKSAYWINTKTSVPESGAIQREFDEAIDEIKLAPEPKSSYTLEAAELEKPYTHYTSPGNIFQILRFGIQSGNFKKRLNIKREDDSVLDMVARQMTGFRYYTGASYQGKDSISLGVYNSRTLGHHDLVLLIDPKTKVFGAKQDERDTSSGYGKGIIVSGSTEGFDINNPIAYGTELLAANIIPPSAIEAVVMNSRASILSELQEVTRDSVLQYVQAKSRGSDVAKEDLFANSRLIASLTEDIEAAAMVEETSKQIDTMSYQDMVTAVNGLQKELLKKFVGVDKNLKETSLREALEKKFGLKFLSVR